MCWVHIPLSYGSACTTEERILLQYVNMCIGVYVCECISYILVVSMVTHCFVSGVANLHLQQSVGVD